MGHRSTSGGGGLPSSLLQDAEGPLCGTTDPTIADWMHYIPGSVAEVQCANARREYSSVQASPPPMSVALALTCGDGGRCGAVRLAGPDRAPLNGTFVATWTDLAFYGVGFGLELHLSLQLPGQEKSLEWFSEPLDVLSNQTDYLLVHNPSSSLPSHASPPLLLFFSSPARQVTSPPNPLPL